MVYRDPIEMVNDYLRRFGEAVSATLDPLDADGYTDVRHGSLIIGINTLVEQGVLLILVRMGRVPSVNKQRLYRKLLELNFLSTGSCAFAIDEQLDWVYLRAVRPLPGLDYEEFADLLKTSVSVATTMLSRLPELEGGT